MTAPLVGRSHSHFDEPQRHGPLPVCDSLPPVNVVVGVMLLVALVALGISARAAVTICVLRVRDGQLRVVRGGVAPRILSDIADVVATPQVGRATLRITRSGGYAMIRVTGVVSEVQQQRLRNVVGSVPLAQLARGRRR